MSDLQHGTFLIIGGLILIGIGQILRRLGDLTRQVKDLRALHINHIARVAREEET